MDGDGTTCPVCKKGKMQTGLTTTGKLYLGCDNWRGEKKCTHKVWSEDPVDPIEGHGLKCEKCNSGTMVTRKAKGGSFLKCSTAPKCDGVIFPESYSSPKKAGGSSGSGGSNVNFGNRPKPASPTGGRPMPGRPLNLARPFKK
jgi:ssDNA-binding Zn-finger/Zn-ribbon topoisomerase 1